MTELARLLDPAELDASTGPHGRMTIDVSSAELGEPVTLVIPRRLVCARCDGGGCDACGRSGAIRVDLDERERTTSLVVPRGASERLRIRLARPLGDDVGIAQLTIEVRIAQAPLSSPTPPLAPRTIAVIVALTIAALALLARSLS